MAIITCLDCSHEISDEAAICVYCGRPNSPNGKGDSINSPWGSVNAAKTPINVFALAMMACTAVLGASAPFIDSEFSLGAFKYSIHAFLAVTTMFFLSLLFCRKGIYHPSDLGNAKTEVLKEMGKDEPRLAAAIIFIMLLAYGGYQYQASRDKPEPEQANKTDHVENNDTENKQKMGGPLKGYLSLPLG
jgi:hypothetical protein